MIVILELFNNTFIINFKIDKIVNAILLIHTYIYTLMVLSLVLYNLVFVVAPNYNNKLFHNHNILPYYTSMTCDGGNINGNGNGNGNNNSNYDIVDFHDGDGDNGEKYFIHMMFVFIAYSAHYNMVEYCLY